MLHRLFELAVRGLALSVLVWPVGLAAADLKARRIGPLTLAGEIAGSLAPEDTAFLNDTGYDVYPLRMLFVSLTAEIRLGARSSVLGEVVSENVDAPRIRALYLRVRPLRDRAFDVQAGRIPPVFGAFARRSYGASNPLIGLPLGYHYLTTLRTDAVAESADGLLAVRGRGWLLAYPVGDRSPAPGLPLVSSRFWDTGLEARIGREPVSLAVAITQGTLSSPRFKDDNPGKQVSARLGWIPRTGLIVGASAARGEYTSRTLARSLPEAQASRSFMQESLAADLEYSFGAWLLRAEYLHSRFDLPSLREPKIASPVAAVALSIEGVRRLGPGLFAAARVDDLRFSQVSGATRSAPWDAPVSRVEAGLGWQPWRPVTLKLTYQRNWRHEGYAGRRSFLTAQAIARF